jgi:hypothetical protein
MIKDDIKLIDPYFFKILLERLMSIDERAIDKLQDFYNGTLNLLKIKRKEITTKMLY